MSSPHIHFIQASTIDKCEDEVNAWIDRLPFLCSVLNINVIPMMLEGKLVFLSIITYMEQPSYVNSKGEVV